MNVTPLRFASLSELEAALVAMAAVTCEEEGLSELDHALQCADEARRMAPRDESLQVAALLHDIGHSHGAAHDAIGAAAVRPLFGDRIAELVGLHVRAKRYLVATEPAYAAALSPVSVESLRLQGGPMSPMEAAEFERFAHWREALLLRRADEAAKQIGRLVPGLERWMPILGRLVALK